MTADDPRKRQPGIKAGEAEAIKVEMSELVRKRNNEHKEIMSEVCRRNINNLPNKNLMIRSGRSWLLCWALPSLANPARTRRLAT